MSEQFTDSDVERCSPEVPENPDYSRTELRQNRQRIFATTLAFIVASWVYVWTGSMDPGGGVALTIIALITAAIFLWLFASSSSTKLDENSAGAGQTVEPRTMGTILGYLFNVFKN